MAYNPVGCSHGIAWGDACVECDKVSMKQNLFSLSKDCEAVADELTRQPALCSDPSVVIDLYRTVQRLANVLMKMNP